jgi:ribosomal protein S18 acetylase RimI-like enzyme
MKSQESKNASQLTCIKIGRDDIILANFLLEYLRNNNREKAARQTVENLLSNDNVYLFAVKADEIFIGYAIVYRFPSLYAAKDLAYLYDVEVLPSHRRIGAGRLLMQTLVTYLKSDGVTEIWLGTATNNFAGQALFLSIGGIKSAETFDEFIFDLT